MALTGLDPTLVRNIQKFKEMHGDTDFVNALMTAQTYWQDTTIATAAVLTLNSVPVQVVAAPGAGFAIVPVAMFSSMVYNSTTYACNASGASLKYTDGSGVAPGLTLTQTYIQSSSSSSLLVLASTTAYIPTANAKLVLVAATSDPTTGNSDMKVRVFYRLIPSPLP